MSAIPLRFGDDGEAIATAEALGDHELECRGRAQAAEIIAPEQARQRYSERGDCGWEAPLDLAAVMPKHFLARQFAAAADRAAGPGGLANGLLRVAPNQAARIALPLMAKTCLRKREPLGFKDGDLCAIPKGQLDSYTSKAFREILLNNTLGKHRRKFMGSVLVQITCELFEDAQTGGRPRRGCDMAVLAVLQGIARSRWAGRSYVAGFYDLQAAFYSVIVEMVHDMPTDPEDMKAVLESIDIPDLMRPILEARLRKPGLLDHEPGTPLLTELAAETNLDR